MSESETDTSRTVVQTYVPAYQRDEWDDHAEKLEMSRSEFVKTMVQAGRRGFGADPETMQDGQESTDDEPLESRILDALTDSECLDWDHLLAEITGDIETRLEEALQELQEDDQVRYSGRQGGYVLETDE